MYPKLDMPAKKIKINLLPQEEFAGTTFGRILSWALSSFRVIVIITEMVVMLAFLSRFWLDARLTDLNELIKQKQTIISSQKDFEKEFRELQKRIAIFAALSKKEPKATTLIREISSRTPGGVLLSSLSIAEDKVLIRAIAESERSVAQFITNLESSDIYQSVILSGVDSDPEIPNGLVFSLNLSTRETKGTEK